MVEKPLIYLNLLVSIEQLDKDLNIKENFKQLYICPFGKINMKSLITIKKPLLVERKEPYVQESLHKTIIIKQQPRKMFMYWGFKLKWSNETT